jgi:hypothetical protein
MPTDTIDHAGLTHDERRWLAEARAGRRLGWRRRLAAAAAVALPIAVALLAAAYLQGRR